jgi:Uma2 family endonuclease
LRTQDPITTADSEPEPDIAVVRGGVRDHAERHPGPGEVALVAEVSDVTVRRDRKKAALYARAGIPVYWIVNLRTRRIEEHTDPRDGAYQVRVERGEGETIAVTLDGAPLGRFAVRDLLP